MEFKVSCRITCCKSIQKIVKAIYMINIDPSNSGWAQLHSDYILNYVSEWQPGLSKDYQNNIAQYGQATSRHWDDD